MAIRKQEFYEGAALHILAQSGRITRLRHDPPLFHVNETLALHLKYSTKGHSPWSFTFTDAEQVLLAKSAAETEVVIGLICGHDGIAALRYAEYGAIAALRNAALHISCRRLHRRHYVIAGPDGQLTRRIAPSAWSRLLDCED